MYQRMLGEHRNGAADRGWLQTRERDVASGMPRPWAGPGPWVRLVVVETPLRAGGGAVRHGGLRLRESLAARDSCSAQDDTGGTKCGDLNDRGAVTLRRAGLRPLRGPP